MADTGAASTVVAASTVAAVAAVIGARLTLARLAATGGLADW